jgi:NitT/TauT family transport system ATP-binding protein
VTAGTAPDGPILELDDVGFTYADGTAALSGLSLSVARGEILGIVGPSGCGKSTLLGIMAGFFAPTEGAVRRSLAGGRHPISMVFQTDTLAPWLDVLDNALLYTRFRSSRRVAEPEPPAERLERVRRLLKMVRLDDRESAYPHRLSGGMRRRLQFLTGVAPLPELLLLDEPFSAVDEPTRVALHQDVLRVIRELSITAVLVTHDLAEAVTLCDRILILSNRPARVATEHEIGFGEQRDVVHIRSTPEYLEVYGRLWDDLSQQIRLTPADRIGVDDGR